MQAMKPLTTEIKARGQLTIPKKIRVMGHLDQGQVVSIIPIGDAVIITPKRLALDEARRELRRLVKAAGISEQDLLQGLQEVREEVYQETYGKKDR